MRAWADLPGAKVPRLLHGRAVREGREVPLLRSQSSTPWSSGGMGSEGWSPFRMTHRPRSPSRLPPRRGVPSRQSGCFPTSGNPARGGRRALATLIACSRLLVTRLFPTGGSLAIERCAPLFPLRTSTPAPDRGKRPKRLVVSRVGRLSLPDPRPAAAPPKRQLSFAGTAVSPEGRYGERGG